MHLIQSLAGGINGGANGTAVLLARGTSTPVTYYQDFEATQPVGSTLAGAVLDANGAAVVYVNQLVDVRVLDVNGAILREFVAGDNATAVEVISPSFLGVDYVTGAGAANKPTTLDAVLALIFGSFGTTNFNVLVGGLPVTVQAAVAGLAGLFFNVKSYGALGDGAADDGASVTAAIAAAVAVGGGIVFFPPGTYRSTTTIVCPTGVSMMGCGGVASRIAWDNGALAIGLSVTTSNSGWSTFSGLWFTAINSDFTNSLVTVNASDVSFNGCRFGAGTGRSKCVLLTKQSGAATDAETHTVVDKCYFNNSSDKALVVQSGGRMTLRSCGLQTYAGAYSNAVVQGTDGLLIDDCLFDASAVTGGTVKYIQFAPASFGACSFTNNRFRPNGTITPVAIFNALATPQYDCYEFGNAFGDLIGGLTVTPYGYTADGYGGSSFTGGHFTRNSLMAPVQTTNANVTVPTKAVSIAVILRNGAGAQVISATEKGRLGDRFTLQINNNSGGVVAPTFGGLLTVRPGYVANIANTGLRVIEFEWMTDLVNSVNGLWLQVATESGG